MIKTPYLCGVIHCFWFNVFTVILPFWWFTDIVIRCKLHFAALIFRNDKGCTTFAVPFFYWLLVCIFGIRVIRY